MAYTYELPAPTLLQAALGLCQMKLSDFTTGYYSVTHFMTRNAKRILSLQNQNQSCLSECRGHISTT